MGVSKNSVWGTPIVGNTHIDSVGFLLFAVSWASPDVLFPGAFWLRSATSLVNTCVLASARGPGHLDTPYNP